MPLAAKDDFNLAHWVVDQRRARRKGKLSAERVQRLDELGFTWEITTEAKQEARWEAKYEALAAYRRAHGHCRVPLTVTDDFSLARWVFDQRRARRTGYLSAERIRRLDALGFRWDVQGEAEQMERAKWEAKYEALVAYCRTHSHCRVPSKDYSHLSKWVARQRVAKRKGKLSAERVRRLNKLKFSWGSRKEARWEAKYEALAAYQWAHGHCRVRSSTKDHASLARWVETQRRARRMGNLSAEQVRRLGALWVPLGRAISTRAS